jgi:hypothetical protein
MTPPNLHKAAEAGRYGLLIAFGVLVVPSVIAWYVSRSNASAKGNQALAGGFRRLLVGEDNRVSTSKTAAVAWTYLLAGALLSIVIAKWLGHGEGLGKTQHSGLAGQYGVLIGGPLGAAILAKGIVGAQVGNSSTTKTPDLTGPSPMNLIANDAGHTDIGDLQYVLFNAVAMIFFLGTLLQSPQDGLPHIPDVLLGLTSVSAAGYVGKKTLSSVAPTATVTPTSARLGESVRITGTGLLAYALATTPIQVLFGSVKSAPVINPSTANGIDTFNVTVPSGLTPRTAVDVNVITPGGIHVTAGSFTPNA